MPSTTIYALRYPASTDPADVPTDLSHLASDVEGALNTKGHAVELAYAEFSSDVNITATVQASAQTLVTAPAVTFDGVTAVMVEFQASRIDVVNVTTGTVVIDLWDGSTDLGFFGSINAVFPSASGTLAVPFNRARRVTPSAGSHTFSARIWQASGVGGPSVVRAGSPNFPGHIRITRV